MGSLGGGKHAAGGRAHHPGLDGLRGVAVLAVVAFHGGIGLRGGALGVDLFLVLSGFLITGLLIGELDRTARVDLGGFWGRRLRRLLPALLVVVAAVVVQGTVVHDTDPRLLRLDALATLGYVANWRFVLADGGYFATFGAPSPLRHAWSLAVEEQWYLLWPPVFWLLWRRLGRRPVALLATLVGLAVASAGLMWRWADDLDRVHYGTDTRAQALLVGAALAVLLRHHPVAVWGDRARRRVRLAGAGGAVVVGWFLVEAQGTAAWLYRGGHLAFAVAAALVVVAALLPEGRVAKVLSQRDLRWLGDLSYGLYLWHWPVFVWLTPDRTGVGVWPTFALRAGVSLALAAASARWVEAPFRDGRVRLPNLGAAAATATALAAGLVVVATAFAPPGGGPITARLGGEPVLPAGFVPGAAASPTTTLPSPPTSALAIAAASSPAPTTAPAPPPVPVLPAAVPDPPDGVLSVAVIGDSTGWTLVWDVPIPRPLRVANGGVLGCGIDPALAVLDGDALHIQTTPVTCDQAPALWLDYLARSHPDVVVLTMGAWEVFDRELPDGSQLRVGTPAWRTWMEASLERAVGAIAAAAPQAAITITDVPCYDERGDFLGGPASPRNDADRVAAVNEALLTYAGANAGRVTLLPMSSWLCDGTTPVGQLDGATLRVDGVHVEGDGAAALWRVDLAPTLLAMVPAP